MQTLKCRLVSTDYLFYFAWKRVILNKSLGRSVIVSGCFVLTVHWSSSMSPRRIQRLRVLLCALIHTIVLFDPPCSVCSLFYKAENITVSTPRVVSRETRLSSRENHWSVYFGINLIQAVSLRENDFFSRLAEVCPARASGFSGSWFTRRFKRNELSLTSEKAKCKKMTNKH